MSKETPILFSPPMVTAIQNGNKTQTRRIVKDAIGWDKNWVVKKISEEHQDGVERYEMRKGTMYSQYFFKCPYGSIGDIIWVRETFYAWGFWKDEFNEKKGKMGKRFVDFAEELEDYHTYKYLDNPPEQVLANRNIKQQGYYKRPSLFMPKDACRLFLKIRDIRVERLRDITEADSKAEGVINKANGQWNNYYNDKGKNPFLYAYGSFMSLWETINGKASWESNPLVWVIEFEKA